MNALYSWEKDSLEGPHDAEAMERSALKRGKTLCGGTGHANQRRVRSKVTSRNLEAGLNVRRGGASQREDWFPY